MMYAYRHLPFSKIAATRSLPSRLTLSTSILCKNTKLCRTANICQGVLEKRFVILFSLSFSFLEEPRWSLKNCFKDNQFRAYLQWSRLGISKDNLEENTPDSTQCGSGFFKLNLFQQFILAMFWKFTSHCFSPISLLCKHLGK